MENDGPYFVLTSAIAKILNPFKHDVWGTGKLRKSVVSIFVKNGDTIPEPNEELRKTDALYDAKRVAHLINHPTTDPIHIECNPSHISIEDGCHRLAAALYRKDKRIVVTYGGFCDVFHKTFRKKEIYTK